MSNILWCLTLAICFTLPLSQLVCTRLIFITFLFSLIIKNKSSRYSLLANAWDVAFYLLILIIGIAYSEDSQSGLNVLETNFSFLALPLIFSKIDNFDKKKLHLIFQFFSFGLISASLICLGNAAINYVKTGDVHAFFFYQLTDLLDFQPTYFAYYIIFSLSFGLYVLNFHQSQGNYKLILISLLFLFLILMLTGGVTSFISILLIFSFFVLKFLLNEKAKIRTHSFATVLLMIAGMFLFSYLYKKIEAPSYKITDHWERIRLWESAIDANPNLWIGVGTGDYKKELNRFYVDHQMTVYARENYNAHNQFLQILFSNGAFGLMAVLILIGRPLYLSVRNQNVLGALTFFPFLIYSMTEVFLGRFQGMVFFALLHQAFITYYYTNNRYVQSSA